MGKLWIIPLLLLVVAAPGARAPAGVASPGADVPLSAAATFQPVEPTIGSHGRWRIPTAEAPLRVLKIQALAGPAFRQRDDWRESIDRRISLASAQFEENFAIRLELAGVDAWDAVDERADLAAAYEAFWRLPVDADADIAVAFLSTGHLSRSVEAQADAENLGRASPFGRHVVLRDTPTLSTQMKIHTFVHELAHLFGALHSGDSRSIMYRYVSDSGGEYFDKLSGQFIWAVRDFDFRLGVECLDAETAQRLDELYASASQEEAHPLVMAWQNRGVELIAARDYDAALQALERALSLDPRRAAAHLDRGLVLRELGRLAEAEAALRRALDCDSRVRGAALNLADTLLRLGRVDDAVVELEREVIRRPDDAEAWHMLGVARAAAGRVDAAIDAYARAVTCDAQMALRPILVPADAPSREQLYEAAAERVETTPDDGEARVRLGLLLRLRDERQAGLTQVARGLELLGKSHGAAALCASLLADAPNDRELLHLSARLALAAGRYDDALRLFGQLLAEDGTDAAACRGLGDAYKGKDMLATALKYYRQADALEGARD